MNHAYNILREHMKTPRYLIKNVTWRFPSTISDVEVIFVMGTPRSGTTLLQKILEAHSGLYSIQAETAIFSLRNYWSPGRKHFDLSSEKVKELLKKLN